MDYSQKVEKIQREIKQKSEVFSIKHKKPSNTLRNSANPSKNKIDLSTLNEVIEIDEKSLTANCEGRVTIQELTKAALRKGLIPLVVPEFTSITVAGAIMGAALESSSFLYGQFADTVEEVDLLLADGTLLKATAEQHSDLFFGISGSYGSIAILTRAKIRLKFAAPYVHLQYKSFKTALDLFAFFKSVKSDFLEGVKLAPDHFLAIAGTLSEKNGLPLFSQKYWGSEWFIDHLAQNPEDELMPIKDYLFRFDRGGFWIGKTLRNWQLLMRTFLRIRLQGVARNVRKASFSKPVSKIFRFLFGWSFRSVALYRIWHRVPKEILENLFFIHDFYAPFEKAEGFLNTIEKKTGIFPVWICPLKGAKNEQFLSPHYGKDFYINCGVYGIPQESNSKELSLFFENEIIAIGGRKMLYSFTYYDENKFWEIYEKKKYLALRKKYGSCSRFPSLYEKVSS